MRVARRPRVWPSASTTYQRRSTSPGFAFHVFCISEKWRTEGPPRRKSSNEAVLALLALPVLSAAEPGGERDRSDEHRSEGLGDRAGHAAVREDRQPDERSHNPVHVYRTINASIAYWVRIAVRAEEKSVIARSCARIKPRTCPETSTPTWTYQIVFGAKTF